MVGPGRSCGQSDRGSLLTAEERLPTLAEVPLADLSFVEEYVDRMPFAFNGRLGKVVIRPREDGPAGP